MSGIKGAIDRLNRLSLIVRTPRGPKEVEQVLRWSQSQGPDGFDEAMLGLIQSMFTSQRFVMPKSLQIQLASAIVHQRNRLRYDARHRKEPTTSRRDHNANEQSSPLVDPENDPPQRTQDYNPGEEKPEVQLPRGALNDMGEGATYPTTHKVQWEVDDRLRIGLHAPPGYPKAPIVPDGENQAACSLCFKPISREVLESEHTWR